MDEEQVIGQTRRWIREVVIGLNLCPFARRVFEGGLISYFVTQADDAESLRAALETELRRFARTPSTQIETTLLIHPNALTDYLDYNDFMTQAEDLIRHLGLEGTIQAAGFHPRYQFEGTQPDDVENYTNRSPYPMIHLLREESISQVNDDAARLEEIPQRNIETLRRLGLKRVIRLLGTIEL